jgi:hypothetical protein
MPSNEPGATDVIAYVTRYVTCDACGGSYEAEHVRVMLHHDGQWVLLAACPVCQSEQRVTGYDQPPYLHFRVPDVVPAEITRETVSGWAAFLAAFEGDIYDLLAQ